MIVAYVRITQEKNPKENKIGIKETRTALGTFVTIDIRNNVSNKRAILDSAFSLIEKYESQLSLSQPKNEIDKINKSIKKIIPISDKVFQLIKKANQISKVSDGAFDITIGAILEEYDFINKKMPSAAEISQKIELVNFQNLQLDKDNLIKKNKNIHIDLGGIAKGFIIDKVIEYLRNQGIGNASVDAGGDLFVMKNNEDEYWKIGIQHPRKTQKIFGTINVQNMAIVTSGDYERYFYENGKRIHHILDPKTGLPANKSVCVTIIAKDAITADALCTAIFVMGPKNGIELANALENVEALVIYEKNGNLEYKKSNGFDKFDFQKSDIKN